ncbi:MAG TPA: cytochrome c3 family protein, partial [Albitalea sp.]
MNLKIPLLRARMLAAAFGLLAAVGLAQAAAPSTLANDGCVQCHKPDKKIEVAAADGKTRKLGSIDHEAFAKGVHAKMQCVDCHSNVVDSQAQHRLAGPSTVTCAGCHEKLWSEARAAGAAEAKPGLGKVAQNIEAYRRSFHVRKSKDDPTKVLADCHECHDTHGFNVPRDRKSQAYVDWRRQVPELCGSCHDDHLESYQDSVHGKQIAEKTDGKGAVCIDCHTTHEITNTSLVSFKLLMPKECGDCHEESLKTYRDTYHGQRTQLGDAQAAKCFDCHGSHEIKKVADKDSMVHPDNRLETCQECH